MMARRLGLITAFLMATVLVGHTAYAQEKPPSGFAMGYPAAAGVLWNVSDTVALWPELIEVRHTSTTTSGSQRDTNAVGAGIRALLYLRPVDAFRTYIAGQFDYTRQHVTTETAVGSGTTAGLGTTTSTYSGAASFGAQYALSARFGVFGEVGIEYDHEMGTGVIRSGGNTTGTRNAVGVIVYF